MKHGGRWNAFAHDDPVVLEHERPLACRVVAKDHGEPSGSVRSRGRQHANGRRIDGGCRCSAEREEALDGGDEEGTVRRVDHERPAIDPADRGARRRPRRRSEVEEPGLAPGVVAPQRQLRGKRVPPDRRVDHDDPFRPVRLQQILDGRERTLERPRPRRHEAQDGGVERHATAREHHQPAIEPTTARALGRGAEQEHRPGERNVEVEARRDDRDDRQDGEDEPREPSARTRGAHDRSDQSRDEHEQNHDQPRLVVQHAVGRDSQHGQGKQGAGQIAQRLRGEPQGLGEIVRHVEIRSGGERQAKPHEARDQGGHDGEGQEHGAPGAERTWLRLARRSDAGGEPGERGRHHAALLCGGGARDAEQSHSEGAARRRPPPPMQRERRDERTQAREDVRAARDPSRARGGQARAPRQRDPQCSSRRETRGSRERGQQRHRRRVEQEVGEMESRRGWPPDSAIEPHGRGGEWPEELEAHRLWMLPEHDTLLTGANRVVERAIQQRPTGALDVERVVQHEAGREVPAEHDRAREREKPGCPTEQPRVPIHGLQATRDPRRSPSESIRATDR
jgi:hypothetical protein